MEGHPWISFWPKHTLVKKETPRLSICKFKNYQIEYRQAIGLPLVIWNDQREGQNLQMKRRGVSFLSECMLSFLQHKRIEGINACHIINLKGGSVIDTSISHGDPTPWLTECLSDVRRVQSSDMTLGGHSILDKHSVGLAVYWKLKWNILGNIYD